MEMSLMKEILWALEQHSGCSLDNEEERRKVAFAIQGALMRCIIVGLVKIMGGDECPEK